MHDDATGGRHGERPAREGGELFHASFTPVFCGGYPLLWAVNFTYGWNEATAEGAADAIANEIAGLEEAFAGRIYDPDSGVQEAMRLAETATRPIVIADTQDNPGAGGDSNTAGMLRALVENRAEGAALGLMVDPAAAEIAHRAGVGAEVNLSFGGHSGFDGDDPFEALYKVEQLHDGRFDATGPFYKGAEFNLGPSARVRVGGTEVVLGCNKVQMADQAMYRFVGIEPTERNILVNKSSVHFRADFAPIAEEILVCAAPADDRRPGGSAGWRSSRHSDQSARSGLARPSVAPSAVALRSVRRRPILYRGVVAFDATASTTAMACVRGFQQFW